MNTPQVRAPHPTKTALGGAAISVVRERWASPPVPIIVLSNPIGLNPGEQEWIEKQRCQRKCDEIEKEIKDAMEEVEDRIEDMLNDPLDLYDLAYDTPNYPATGTKTTWEGHQIAAESAQNRLYRAIMDAIRNHCPVPPKAWALALRKLPKMPRGR